MSVAVTPCVAVTVGAHVGVFVALQELQEYVGTILALWVDVNPRSMTELGVNLCSWFAVMYRVVEVRTSWRVCVEDETCRARPLRSHSR